MLPAMHIESPRRIHLLTAGTAITASLIAALAGAPGALAVTPVKCEQAPLQAAINAATSGEIIQVEAGTCEVNLTVSNAEPFTLEGKAPGTTLKPATTTTPILEAKKPASGVLSFALSNLTFTGTTSASAVRIGSPAEAVTIAGDTFVSNTTLGGGGALYFEGGSGGTTKPTVIAEDTFGQPGAGNTAEYGGAVYVQNGNPLELTRNTFQANHASSPSFGAGGAVVIANFSGEVNPLTISENTFGGPIEADANTTTWSGGGLFLEPAHNEPVALEANTFMDNAIAGSGTAEAPRVGAGVAITVNGSGQGFTVTQRENEFVGNVIKETDKSNHEPAGGAGEWVLGATVNSTLDLFESNSIPVTDGETEHPPEGGGLGVLSESGSVAAFTGTDDLFRGNTVASGGWGGAIYAGFHQPYCASSCPGSSITLQDSTVTGNSVEPGAESEGGALWGGPTDELTIENSILYGNTPQPQIFGFGGATTFAYSDICNEPGATSGPGVICANPLLTPSGEETASSPTIGTGSVALVPAGLTTDLSGNPRITTAACGNVVDMGAFEWQIPPKCPAPPPPSPPHTSSTPPGSTPPSGATTSAPVISRAAQSNGTWRPGSGLARFSVAKRKRRRLPVGTTFSFSLSEPASVSLSFTQQLEGRKLGGRCVAKTHKNRKRKTCARTEVAGALSFAGHVGTNSVAFQGRLSASTRLKPGHYTLTILATNSAGQRSAPVSLAFTIVK
jgi:hypothetical protein